MHYIIFEIYIATEIKELASYNGISYIPIAIIKQKVHLNHKIILLMFVLCIIASI